MSADNQLIEIYCLQLNNSRNSLKNKTTLNRMIQNSEHKYQLTSTRTTVVLTNFFELFTPLSGFSE